MVAGQAMQHVPHYGHWQNCLHLIGARIATQSRACAGWIFVARLSGL